jgi:hypothetical protein
MAAPVPHPLRQEQRRADRHRLVEAQAEADLQSTASLLTEGTR